MSLTPAETESLLDRMTDPLNRVYRYPVVRWLLKTFPGMPFSPNQITFFHTLISLIAAAFLARGYLFVAFLTYEIRAILDCLDGELARARGAASTNGRMIDALADLVAILGMMGGSAIYLFKTEPEMQVMNTLVPLGLLLIGVAAIYDFYKRKITCALLSGHDDISYQLVQQALKISKHEAGWLAQLTYVADWMQICVLSPGAVAQVNAGVREALSTGQVPDLKNTAEAQRIVAHAQTPQFGHFIVWLSGLGSDNILGILNLGLLTGFYAASIRFALIYGVVMAVGAIILFQKTTHDETSA